MKNSNFMQQIIALHLTPDLSITTSPEMLCDFVGRISQNADTEELQALMEETNVSGNDFDHFDLLLINHF